MGIRLTPILIKTFPRDESFAVNEINKGLTEIVDGVREDLRKPTRTFSAENKPSFATKRINTEKEIGVEVYLNGETQGNQNYERLDDGTASHDIPYKGKTLVFPQTFTAKTIPGTLTSQKGSKSENKYFIRHDIHVPGIRARNFVDTVSRLWDTKFDGAMDKAIEKIAKKLQG